MASSLGSVFIFLLSVVTFSYEESLQEPCSSPIYVRIQDGIGQDCRAAEHVSQYTCPTLQSALEFGELQPPNCNITVSVPQGTHFILKPVSISASFELIGNSSRDSTVLNCSFSTDQLELETNYTVYFDHSDSVHLQDLSMYDCPLPFSFDTVSDLLIDHVAMSYFQEAALEIYNCKEVQILNSLFEGNNGTGTSEVPFRGNTGAVSIGFYNIVSPKDLRVDVSNTTFVNNSALANGTFRSTSHAFFKGILPGRAGGLGVFIHEDYTNVTVKVNNCTFQDNYARSYGGGLYFVYSGSNENENILGKKPQFKGFVTNSSFISNTAGLGGGGFIITIQTSGPVKTPHLLHFDNCIFKNNAGQSGGGFYYYVIFHGGRGNSLAIRNTSFFNNRGNSMSSEFGSAFAASIYQEYRTMEGFPIHVIESCTFANNVGANGIVSLGYMPFRFNGTNVFRNNTGDSLRVIGSQAIFHGTMKFISNSALDGGALSLMSFAQLRLSVNLTILFINNTGRYGASIYVNPFDQSGVFKQLFYNPHCFFLPNREERRLPAVWNKDDRINMTFTGNTAWFGSALYVSSLSQCSWISESGPEFFNKSFFPDWPMFNIEQSNRNKGFPFPDSDDQSHSIVTDVVNFVSEVSQISAWPGKIMKVNVTTRDELGGSTGSVIRMKYGPINEHNRDEDEVRLTPNTFLEVKEPFQTRFKFSVQSPNTLAENQATGNISLQQISSTAIQQLETNGHQITLNASYCPGGYTLTDIPGSAVKSMECVCERKQTEIIQCARDQDTIIIQTGQWAVRVPGEELSLRFYTCPPGYCQCIYHTEFGNSTCSFAYSNSFPDRQCSCGRKGVLCGTCLEGWSTTALLDECVSCEFTLSWPWFLLIGFLDVVIVIIIVVIDRPLPSWVYPVLFYVQITPLLTLYFPPTFLTLGKCLYYASSLVGLYLPYDFCLDKDIRGIGPHALRFIPMLISSIIVPILIIANALLVKHRVWKHSLKMHGVWTVFLLIFTSTVYNAMRNLNCLKIPNMGNYWWYINGSVQCFANEHLILTFLGILTLLGVLVLVVFILLITQKKDCSMRWAAKLAGAITYPYHKEFLFWGIVDITSKLLLLLFTVALPGNKIVIVLLLSLVLVVSSYSSPYRCKWTNCLQTAIFSLMLILLMLDATNSLSYILPPPAQKAMDKDDCNQTSDVSDTTPEAIVLLILYFAPVFISVLSGILYVLTVIMKKVHNRKHGRYLYEDLNNSPDHYVRVTEIWLN